MKFRIKETSGKYKDLCGLTLTLNHKFVINNSIFWYSKEIPTFPIPEELVRVQNHES